jgi:hypothetical protein
MNCFNKKNIDLFIFIILFYIILNYSLNISSIYPTYLLELFEEKIVKIILYFILFLLVNYNKILGLQYLIILLTLELDILLFYQENN